MNNQDGVVLTKEGYEKLDEELQILVTKKRKEVAQRIKEAIAFGDLSENSEYDDAKNEQAFIEGRIQQINEMLNYAKLIDDDEIVRGKVCVGSWVTLKDMENKEEFECQIVGSAEANPSEHKLSNESPVGQAIIGLKAGQLVKVKAPKGNIDYQILKVSKSHHKTKVAS
jgi:transcription elongation factor GreA